MTGISLWNDFHDLSLIAALSFHWEKYIVKLKVKKVVTFKCYLRDFFSI